MTVGDADSPQPAAASTIQRHMARAKMLGKFVSVQALAQAIGVASGILLVRSLSRREYALFTIANSMQGTMNLLADTGLSIGLSSIGGRVWQDRDRFGQLIATTMRLRRTLAAISVAVVTPILVWMLVANGSSYTTAGILTLAVLLGLNSQLVIGVLVVVPRLLSQVSRLQVLDLSSALVRLVLVVAAYFIFLNAVTAILASVVMYAWQYALVRRWAAEGVEIKAPTNVDDRRAMLRIVRNQAPTAVFYCIQGQIIVWLMSLFGNTRAVADIGALGRLSILFSIVGSVMTTIIVPRFARCHSPRLLRRRFIQITAGFVLFGAALITFTAVLPDALLWVLGSKYALLRRELMLMMILTTVTTIAEAMWSLNAAKAWIAYSWIHVPSTLALQVVLLLLLKVSTLHGALLFGIFSLGPSIVLNIVLAVRGLRGARKAPT